MRFGHRFSVGFALTLAVVASVTLPLSASAQQSVPGSVEPGRIPQQFKPAPGPAPTPSVVTPEIPEAVAPADAEKIHFQLAGVVIDGATVYTSGQLEPLYKDYVGHEVSLTDVYRIADIITAKYRSDGYVLSRAVIPAQRISDGVVRIEVVEGFINRAMIEGQETPALRLYADRLTERRPLTSDDLQRYLLLANDIPGIVARGVLAPAVGVRGGSDLTIISEGRPEEFTVSLDNHGSRFVGPIQLYGEAAINDATGNSDRLGFRYITAPQNESELRYFELNYALPIGSDGLNLSVFASGNQSEPGGTLNTSFLRTVATGESWTVRLSYPLIRTREQNLILDAAFAYLDAYLDQFAEPSDLPLITSYEDHIRVLRVSARYDLLEEGGARDFLRLELSRGLPIFGATRGAQLFGVSRPGGRSEFWKADLDASRLQPLNGLLPGLNLFGALTASASFGQELLASEQFGVGGAQYGRGYDPSIILGDYGAAAKTELQYSFAGPTVYGVTSVFQAYGFFDFGLTANAGSPTPGAIAGWRNVASTGGGLRFALSNGISADLDLAQPLTLVPTAIGGDRTPLRGYFSLIATF